MKIEYKLGNLLDTHCNIIVHGCNNKGVMGSGVALAIRNAYPKAYQEYKARTSYHLGDVIFVPVTDTLHICNGVTQDGYGRDGRQYVKYDAVREVIASVNEYAKNRNISEIALPMIGAGLGGGNWEIIKNIIEEETTFVQPIVYVMDKKTYSMLGK